MARVIAVLLYALTAYLSLGEKNNIFDVINFSVNFRVLFLCYISERNYYFHHIVDS